MNARGAYTMSGTITKVRRLPDGSLEHYQEAPARPTVAEVVAAVNALVERSKTAEQAEPNAGREVVAVCMTPRGPDGSGGTIEKVIRVGPKPTQEYAEPVPYWELTGDDDRQGAPGDVGAPAAPDELAALKDEEKKLQAILDHPATGAIDRQRTGYRLTAIRARIEQLEAALHPTPPVGAAPTAGQAQQFAAPVPYWQRGAELNATRRAQLEAEAAGLEGQLGAGTLTPAETIRTEQALKALRAILAEARPDDWHVGQR